MHILIGVDGSQAAEVACEFVANRTWPIGTRIELVGAISPELIKRDRIAARDALRQTLDDRGDSLRKAGLTVSTEIIDGDPADSLVDRAGNTFADLIVVGNRGLGPVGSAVIGSVSAHLIDQAPCPVLVARSPSATRMVLASDGTHSSRKIPRILAAWRPRSAACRSRSSAWHLPRSSSRHGRPKATPLAIGKGATSCSIGRSPNGWLTS